MTLYRLPELLLLLLIALGILMAVGAIVDMGVNPDKAHLYNLTLSRRTRIIIGLVILIVLVPLMSTTIALYTSQLMHHLTTPGQGATMALTGSRIIAFVAFTALILLLYGWAFSDYVRNPDSGRILRRNLSRRARIIGLLSLIFFAMFAIFQSLLFFVIHPPH